MNLGDFRTRQSGEIGLSVNSPSELALMDGFANDSVVQFLIKTKCYVKPFSMALTAGEDDYDLPTSILALKSLHIAAASGEISPMLKPRAEDDIFECRRFPSGGYQPLGYALSGANLLMLSSAANSSSDLLEGLYVPRPTKMTSAAHDPSTSTYGGVPEEFHEVLVAYQLWKAASWDDDSSSQIGMSYKADWETGVAGSKVLLAKKAGVRWAPARPKRSRRFQARTPGTDTGY